MNTLSLSHFPAPKVREDKAKLETEIGRLNGVVKDLQAKLEEMTNRANQYYHSSLRYREYIDQLVAEDRDGKPEKDEGDDE